MRFMRLMLVLSGFSLFFSACSTTPDQQSLNPLFNSANDQVLLFSEDQEKAMGQQAATQYLAQSAKAPQAVADYVSSVGMRLAAVSERSGLPWSFHTIQSSEVNAFALPGGVVFVTSGILQQMKDEAQLSAVLGHEIAHVVKRHALKRAQRQMVTDLGLEVFQGLLGSRAKLLAAAGGMATNLVILRNSRENELEADELGIRLSASAGYDPNGMIELQEMLMGLSKTKGTIVDEMLSTHPLSENRISQARKIMGTVQGSARNADAYKKSISALK
jgi:predicted Zn-dependent protease